MTGLTLATVALVYTFGATIPSLFRRDWDDVARTALHIGTFSAMLWFLWL